MLPLFCIQLHGKVKSHFSIYKNLENHMKALVINWFNQILESKLHRKCYIDINWTKIWQQNNGIGLISKQKYQYQEMLKKAVLEHKDLEYTNMINVDKISGSFDY